ncbi:MAG: 50S ribosomal protein L24 [Candidatus Gygaella obscura]|nr:50S ribosomal protein L24 [Candidatus Gygaella obscura]
MQKIKKNDIVYVICGKDKGKIGKVIKVFQETQKAIVERVNLVKKHMKKRSQEQQSGIVSVERPVSIAKLMVQCKKCNKPVRIGFKFLENKEKVRICKKCKEVI